MGRVKFSRYDPNRQDRHRAFAVRMVRGLVDMLDEIEPNDNTTPDEVVLRAARRWLRVMEGKRG